MKRLITTFFILSTLVGGVLAGTPLHTPNDKMMKCCDKAKNKVKSPSVKAAMLCCAVNCSDPTPTSSGFSANFSPSGETVTESIFSQIAALFPSRPEAASSVYRYQRETLSHNLQPTYIQNHSFLI